MSDVFERAPTKDVALKDVKGSRVELVFHPGIINANIFVWYKDNGGAWNVIHSTQNDSGRAFIGKTANLNGDGVELVFEIKKSLASGEEKYDLAGHLEADGQPVESSRLELKGKSDHAFYGRALRWSFT